MEQILEVEFLPGLAKGYLGLVKPCLGGELSCPGGIIVPVAGEKVT